MNARVSSPNKKDRANEITDRRDENYEYLVQALAREQFHIFGQLARYC